MKRRIQAWIFGLLLTLIALPADAAMFDVTARGRDAEVAQTNAGVNAVRDCMQRLVSKDFLRANMEAVRKQIILQSARFVRAVTVTSQQPQGTVVVLQASVDVDATALAEALARMNMDDAAKQHMTAALAEMEPAEPAPVASAEAPAQPVIPGLTVSQAPAQPSEPAPAASAEAPAQSATDAVSAMAGGGVVMNGDGLPLPGQGGRETLPDNNAYVRSDDAPGMDIYIDNMRTLGTKILSPEMLYALLGDKMDLEIRILLSINVRDIRIRVDEKKHVTWLATPVDTAQMQAALVEGKSLRDVLAILGITDEVIPQDKHAAFKRRLRDTRHDRFTILQIENSKVFCSQFGSLMVISDHKPNVVETMAMLEEGLTPFTVKGQAPLRFCARKTTDDMKGVERVTTEMQPVQDGWIVSCRAEGGVMAGLGKAAPMDLSGLLVCDNNPPFFMAGLGNSPYSAILFDKLQANGTLTQSMRAMLEKLDSTLLSLGGGQIVASSLCLPSFTLGVKGAPEALQSLAALVASVAPGQDSPVAGWDKVTTHPLHQVIGIPLNIVLAQRGNTLVGGLTNAQNLARPQQDARALLASTLEGSGLTLPEASSGIVLFNMRQCWQEIHALLQDPMMATMLEAAGSDTLQALQQLFITTPPITSIAGWIESSNAIKGVFYITMSKEDSTPFYQAFKNLIAVFKN